MSSNELMHAVAGSLTPRQHRYFYTLGYASAHLKGFTQKWKFCQYLLTLMLFQTFMCLFVLLYTKEDIWKNVLIKQISFPI